MNLPVDAPLKEAIDAIAFLFTIACVPILLWLFVALVRLHSDEAWKPRRRRGIERKSNG